MTNENNVSVEETVKAKRPSRVKPRKTGAQIIEEITTLQAEVAELEDALQTLEAETTAHDIVGEAVEGKKAELEAALNHTYTA